MRIVIISKPKRIITLLIIIISIALFSGMVIIARPSKNASKEFDAQRAYNDVKYQVDLGPRTLGSVAHAQVAQWIITNLQESGWQVETQAADISGQHIENIIAKKRSGVPWVIIGSHYDSRSVADQDPNPDLRNQAVPGANDGASTVAILLELGRIIPNNLNEQVWLVFFDDEDNGNSSGTGWSIGSQYFVSKLEGNPNRVVILDMLGDKNLDIYMEKNSNPEINDEIWSIAKQLGFPQFIHTYRYAIIDDHLPFIEAGIKATDIIDINYPYWHTTQDTLDKISAESLNVVGETILNWLEQYPQN
jgi:glutaminyl-peptide cyclotransferase